MMRPSAAECRKDEKAAAHEDPDAGLWNRGGRDRFTLENAARVLCLVHRQSALGAGKRRRTSFLNRSRSKALEKPIVIF